MDVPAVSGAHSTSTYHRSLFASSGRMASKPKSGPGRSNQATRVSNESNTLVDHRIEQADRKKPTLFWRVSAPDLFYEAARTVSAENRGESAFTLIPHTISNPNCAGALIPAAKK
jgi:hypothetical protein